LLNGRQERFSVHARAVIREKLPYVLLAAVFGLVALFAQADAKALKAVDQYGFAARVAQAFYGLTFYIWKTILPFSLSPLYELPAQLDPFAWGFLISGLVVIGLTLFFISCDSGGRQASLLGSLISRFSSLCWELPKAGHNWLRIAIVIFRVLGGPSWAEPSFAAFGTLEA
jgi:hypothetical protein